MINRISILAFALTITTLFSQTYSFPKVFSLCLNDNGHLFAGTNFGVFSSRNNGDSWEQKVDVAITRVLAMKNMGAGYLFAGTDSGLYQSKDNGESWEKANFGLDSVIIAAFCVADSGLFIAGSGGHGCFFSRDNGDTWTPGTLNTSKSVTALAVNDSGYVFAGRWAGLLVSRDNANTWNSCFSSWDYYIDIRAIAIGPNGYVYAASCQNYSTQGGIYRSKDNGLTWAWANTGMDNETMASIVINSQGVIFASTYQTGIYRSFDDGDSWALINAGLGDLSVYSLAINEDGTIFAGTYTKGIFKSTDNGDTWSAVNTGLVGAERKAPKANTGISINGIYPNPFNPVTRISFSLKAESLVSLDVFNPSGVKMASVLNGTFSPGTHTMVFNGKDLASGTYILSLKAGPETVKKTVFLCR